MSDGRRSTMDMPHGLASLCARSSGLGSGSGSSQRGADRVTGHGAGPGRAGDGVWVVPACGPRRSASSLWQALQLQLNRDGHAMLSTSTEWRSHRYAPPRERREQLGPGGRVRIGGRHRWQHGLSATIPESASTRWTLCAPPNTLTTVRSNSGVRVFVSVFTGAARQPTYNTQVLTSTHIASQSAVREWVTLLFQSSSTWTETGGLPTSGVFALLVWRSRCRSRTPLEGGVAPAGCSFKCREPPRVCYVGVAESGWLVCPDPEAQSVSELGLEWARISGGEKYRRRRLRCPRARRG